MRFVRWITLPLLGMGVLFAHDGAAATDVIHKEEGVLRKRRSTKIQQASMILDNPADSSYSANTDNNKINHNNSRRSGSNNNDTEIATEKRQLTEEDAWWQSFVKNAVLSSFSMVTEPPTKTPTNAPIVTPSPTEAPSPNPTTESPTISPTSAPPVPTQSPTIRTMPPTKDGIPCDIDVSFSSCIFIQGRLFQWLTKKTQNLY